MKCSIDNNIQVLLAYNPKRRCQEEMMLSSNILYKIIFENADIQYGWFDTSLKVLNKIHKSAGFKTLDQLVYLDYIIDANFQVKKEGKIYDVEQDIKHLVPVEMRFFRTSVNEISGVLEEIECHGGKFTINLSLPIFIKLHSGIHRGFYINKSYKGIINKIPYIVISPLRASHPNIDHIALPTSDICDMYNIKIDITEI